MNEYERPGGDLPPNHFAFGGVWKVDDEPATAVEDATIDVQFTARRVFLVMSSKDGKPRHVKVEVDGKPSRTVTVTGQRLYTLVDMDDVGEHRLSLRFDPGVSGYAFTFG